MSDANIQIVQSIYACFGRGDIAGLMGHLDPDIHWEVVGQRSDYPLFGARHGHAGVQDFFETLAVTEEITAFSPREIHASADKVFAIGHAAYVMKRAGRPASSDWVHVFTIRDGRVTAWQEYLDTAQIAAANRP